MAESSKKILFACVLRGKEVISEYEAVHGQARAFALVIADEIEPGQSRHMSFVHESIAAHYVSRPSGLVFLAVSRGSVNRRVPFLLLMSMQDAFVHEYGEEATEVNFNDELKRLVGATERGETDKAGMVQSEIDQVQSIMIENVERVLERGERINLLVSKTDRMNNNAVVFRKRAASAQRNMYWQNVKLKVLGGAVCGGIAYGLLGVSCGFPDFGSCRGV